MFDSHYHGHDGFLFNNARERAVPRPPLQPWRCLRCGATFHHGRVMILSDDKFLYFEDGYAEKFGPERWPDAFGCFALGITCCGCGRATPNWIDYEAR